MGVKDYSQSDMWPWLASSSSGAGARLLRSLPRLEWLSDRKLARDGLLRMDCRGVRATLPLDSDRADRGEEGNVVVKKQNFPNCPIKKTHGSVGSELIELPECRLLMLPGMKVFLSLLVSLSSESLPSLSLESTVETERTTG